MFKKIKIENFKALKNFEIDLSENNIIIGNNATGKSTLLQAIDFLCSSVKEDFSIIMERRNWKVSNIKSKLASTPRMHFSVEINLMEGKETHQYSWDMILNALTAKNKIQLVSEMIQVDGETVLEYLSGKEGFIVTDKKNRTPILSLLSLESSFLKYIKNSDDVSKKLKVLIRFLENSSSFEMLSPNEMRLSSRGNKESIGMSGKNLSSFIKQMNEEQKEKYIQKVKYILNGKIADVSTETKGKPGWIELNITESYGDNSLKINSKEMSDGMLRLLAFVAISEINSSDAIMLLDEIENGINIDYAERLMKVLGNMYTDHRHQLMMTTHSTVFIDYINPSDIIYLYRDEHGAIKGTHIFNNTEYAKKLEYMYPGEVLLNIGQAEILDNLLSK